jgi:hypothetical protein
LLVSIYFTKGGVMAECLHCKDTGVRGTITGAESMRHFQNFSPEPIHPGREGIDASTLPGRQQQK